MQISCFRNFRSKKPGSSTLEAIAEYIRTDRSLAQITALYRKDGSKTIKEARCGGIRGYWVMERSAEEIRLYLRNATADG